MLQLLLQSARLVLPVVSADIAYWSASLVFGVSIIADPVDAASQLQMHLAELAGKLAMGYRFVGFDLNPSDVLGIVSVLILLAISIGVASWLYILWCRYEWHQWNMVLKLWRQRSR